MPPPPLLSRSATNTTSASVTPSTSVPAVMDPLIVASVPIGPASATFIPITPASTAASDTVASATALLAAPTMPAASSTSSKLAQTTPAHVPTASPTIRKDLADKFHTRRIEASKLRRSNGHHCTDTPPAHTTKAPSSHASSLPTQHQSRHNHRSRLPQDRRLTSRVTHL